MQPKAMQPKVTLLSWTDHPLETLRSIWEASRHNGHVPSPEDYAWAGKHTTGIRDQTVELALKIIAAGIPVAENISFTFLLEGISISLREQMVRHRVGHKHGPRIGMDIIPDLPDSTWWSQSMRILDMGMFAVEGAYREPEEFPIGKIKYGDQILDPRYAYRLHMERSAGLYSQLADLGMALEDAREVIPLATTHRTTWSLNLMALKHVIGKRGCWILQLGIWKPIILGIVEELATKVDPIFRELIAPPCINAGKFTGCHFKLDNERRIAGEDEIPPCSLYLHNHSEEATLAADRARTESPGGPRWADATGGWRPVGRGAHGRTERFLRMRSDYRELWQRDVDTGVKLTVEGKAV